MPMYDYACRTCQIEEEIICPMAERHAQSCERCGTRLELILKPQRAYVPFNPYYDEGLDVHVTGRDHRRRVMRDLKVDHRDPPSKGDLSARADRAHQRRREAMRG